MRDFDPVAPLSTGMISRPCPNRIRGARAMLDWSFVELAKAAHASVASVLSVEGRGVTLEKRGAIRAVRTARGAAGISFLEDDGLEARARLRGREARNLPA